MDTRITLRLPEDDKKRESEALSGDDTEREPSNRPVIP